MTPLIWNHAIKTVEKLLQNRSWCLRSTVWDPSDWKPLKFHQNIKTKTLTMLKEIDLQPQNFVIPLLGFLLLSSFCKDFSSYSLKCSLIIFFLISLKIFHFASFCILKLVHFLTFNPMPKIPCIFCTNRYKKILCLSYGLVTLKE